MSKVLAVFTSDPNLIRCELRRLEGEVQLAGGQPSNAVGMGSYAQDEVLLERYAFDPELSKLPELWSGPESEAFLYHGQRLPVGLSLEENTQPFRFRRWLFAHDGAIEGFAAMRTKLLSALPEFLRRQIRGDTDSEAACALFLKLLRDTGRTEDRHLDAALAAQLLGRVVRTIEQLGSEAGATGKSRLNFVATNGSLLAATRYGGAPLYYRFLEGSDRCDRCGIDPSSPDTQLAREHRRRRTVAVASHLARPAGWIELSDGSALAVDRNLDVQTLPI